MKIKKIQVAAVYPQILIQRDIDVQTRIDAS